MNKFDISGGYQDVVHQWRKSFKSRMEGRKSMDEEQKRKGKTHKRLAKLEDDRELQDLIKDVWE